MKKYKPVLIFSDGETYDDGYLFDSIDDAWEHGSYLKSCSSTGNSILNASNPGDYPLDDDSPSITIEEVDE